MTQTSETNSRIARLEALMLEIAASNLRHDRDIDNQSEAIDRHEQRITEHEEWQAQQEQHIEEWQRQQESAITTHEREMAEIRSMQRLNQEQLAELTAGLLELRNLVANYIQSRAQIDE